MNICKTPYDSWLDDVCRTRGSEDDTLSAVSKMLILTYLHCISLCRHTFYTKRSECWATHTSSGVVVVYPACCTSQAGKLWASASSKTHASRQHQKVDCRPNTLNYISPFTCIISPASLLTFW